MGMASALPSVHDEATIIKLNILLMARQMEVEMTSIRAVSHWHSICASLCPHEGKVTASRTIRLKLSACSTLLFGTWAHFINTTTACKILYFYLKNELKFHVWCMCRPLCGMFLSESWNMFKRNLIWCLKNIE